MVATAIVAAVGIAAAKKASDAQKKAARKQEEAAVESADFLAEAGAKAETDIVAGAQEAIETVGKGATEAEELISPFGGTNAFESAQNQILEGLPLSGPIADSIKQSSSQFVLSRPEMFDLSDPVMQEVAKNSGFIAEGFEPDFRENLIASAQQEIGTAGDIAGIRSRGLESLADISASTGAQRASALIGQAPQLADLSSQVGESRLLSDIAGQRANTQIVEQLAGLTGSEIERRKK